MPGPFSDDCDQAVERRVVLLSAGEVDQERVGGPGFGSGLVGAGGRQVEALIVGVADGGRGVVGGIGGHARECLRRVGGDPLGCHGGDLVGEADAVDEDVLGPQVAGEFGGQVAGEVVHEHRVSGEVDSAGVFQVEQPDTTVVVVADGDQQRPRRRLIRRRRSDRVAVDGRRDRPGPLTGLCLPSRSEVAGFGQVQGQRGLRQLDGDQVRHRSPAAARAAASRRRMSSTNSTVGRGQVAGGDDRLLHRRQPDARGGHHQAGLAAAPL